MHPSFDLPRRNAVFFVVAFQASGTTNAAHTNYGAQANNTFLTFYVCYDNLSAQLKCVIII